MRFPRALLAACGLVAASAARADADGHGAFFLCQKALESGEGAPIDRQPEVGVVRSFGRDEWPIHIAADVFASGKDGTLEGPIPVDVSGGTFEVDAGVRKIWGRKAVHPYAGAGIAILAAA